MAQASMSGLTVCEWGFAEVISGTKFKLNTGTATAVQLE